jgi:SH3-like domain-containing protein
MTTGDSVRRARGWRRAGAAVPLALVLALGWPAGPAAGQNAVPETTGLPLPRFASLRANEINMRAGPGIRYPVDWVYQRRNLPVEIVAEYGTWRKVRDWQGTQGWVHQSVLGTRRQVIVIGAVRTLRRKAEPQAPALARAEPGVVGRLIECPDGSAWCRIEAGGFEGWLKRDEMWGVYPNEVVP